MDWFLYDGDLRQEQVKSNNLVQQFLCYRKFYYALTNLKVHCVKSVQIVSFSGPHFPVFGMNTGKYGPKILRR